MNDLRKSMTPKEIAEKFGYNVEYIRRLVREGELRAEKIGMRYLIDPDSFREYWHRKGRIGRGRLKAMKRA